MTGYDHYHDWTYPNTPESPSLGLPRIQRKYGNGCNSRALRRQPSMILSPALQQPDFNTTVSDSNSTITVTYPSHPFNNMFN
jgi:hypothetical protein